MKFDAGYHELVTLADGRAVELRLVRPDDKEILVRGFQRQSAESRFRRFFTEKESLTESELKYLTEVDGENHFAIGAVEGNEGRGIARFVKLKDRPTVAEWAIAVDDAVHGLGLGRILFQRLCDAARERGVERLRCDVLAFNDPMKKLLADLGPDVEGDGLVMAMEFPLVEENPLYRLFKYAAEGVVSVAQRLLALPGRVQDEGVGDDHE